MRPRLKEALPNLVSLCDRCHRLMHHEPDTTGWGASRCGLCLAHDSSLWSRPAESTNLHNAERTRAFATEYADRPLRSIDSLVVAEWLKGGKNRGTVDALRAMFNDARRPQAGMLLDVNPFGGLGLKRTKGRKHVQPPDPSAIARLIAAADELTPPSFAAYLVAAIWSAARPGELDGLMLDDLDFTPGAEAIRIERQWNIKAQKITIPKHDSRRTIAMVDPLRERLLSLPRESEWVFTTLRGTHYTPSSRNYHWNRVRASVGLGNVSLYLATRHYYGWCALNVLELPAHVIALHLGHDDGGQLVRANYGHPDAAIARKRTRDAFREVASVTALPGGARHELRHDRASRVVERIRVYLPDYKMETRALARQAGGFSANCGASPPISCQLALYATCRWKLGSSSRSRISPAATKYFSPRSS
jgi:integrase